MNNKEKFTTYTYSGKLGITDLKSASPYNEYGDFYQQYDDISEFDYLKNPSILWNRVAKDNKEYIDKLNQSGEYGKEYKTNITLVNNPLFDNPKPMKLESASIKFIDFSKYE